MAYVPSSDLDCIKKSCGRPKQNAHAHIAPLSNSALAGSWPGPLVHGHWRAPVFAVEAPISSDLFTWSSGLHCFWGPNSVATTWILPLSLIGVSTAWKEIPCDVLTKQKRQHHPKIDHWKAEVKTQIQLIRVWRLSTDPGPTYMKSATFIIVVILAL